MGLSVDEIQVGQKDAGGHLVEQVFHKVSGVYAVYFAAGAVRVHHADDPVLAEKQRQVLAPIVSLTSDVDMLVANWRKLSDWGVTRWFFAERRAQAKAEYFTWRIADGMALSMQWHPDAAVGLLERSKEDVLAERRAKARYYHLVLAFVLAAAAVLLGFRDSIWPTARPGWSMVRMMAGAGALGAFFSIATGLKSRTIKIDLNYFENILDAVLRVLIGVIAGMVMGWLVFSGILPVRVPGGVTVATWSSATTMFMLVLGFLAGFLERLVPDLLAKTGGTVSGLSPAVAGGATTATVAADRVALNERTAAVLAGAAGGATVAAAGDVTDTDAEMEGCAHEAETEIEHPAEDEELPEATGGVATDGAASGESVGGDVMAPAAGGGNGNGL